MKSNISHLSERLDAICNSVKNLLPRNNIFDLVSTGLITPRWAGAINE